MPGRDGTGPQGLGPMTGRGFGSCAAPVVPQVDPRLGRGRGGPGRGRGRGFGQGFGRGMGRRNIPRP